MLQLNVNKMPLIFSTFRVYTTVNSSFLLWEHNNTLSHFKKDETLMILAGKLGKSHCKYERMFFRVYEGASRQQHKEQLCRLCHSNMARRRVRVWSSWTNFHSLSSPLSVYPLGCSFARRLLFMQKWELGFICSLTKGEQLVSLSMLMALSLCVRAARR